MKGHQGGKCSLFFLRIFFNNTSRKAHIVLQYDVLSSYFYRNRKE